MKHTLLSIRERSPKASVVRGQDKPPLALPFQLPVNTPGEVVDDGLSVWTSAIHVGDQNGAPGFGFTALTD